MLRSTIDFKNNVHAIKVKIGTFFGRLISFFDCKDFSESRIVFALKFVVALTELCPQMKLCVDTEQVSRLTLVYEKKKYVLH